MASSAQALTAWYRSSAGKFRRRPSTRQCPLQSICGNKVSAVIECLIFAHLRAEPALAGQPQRNPGDQRADKHAAQIPETICETATTALCWLNQSRSMLRVMSRHTSASTGHAAVVSVMNPAGSVASNPPDRPVIRMPISSRTPSSSCSNTERPGHRQTSR